MLQNIPLMLEITRAVVDAVKIPVTVKTRLGWEAGAPTAPALAQLAEKAGLSLVTVHGRTRCHFYKGTADWAAIRAVTEAVRLPVIANGDLTDARDAPAMLAASGAQGVMIGRGAQGRPWFPGHVARFLTTGRVPAPPSLEAQRDMLLELYEGWLSLYGVVLGVRQARKHVGWALEAAADCAGPAALTPGWVALWRERLLTCEEPDRVRTAIRAAFDDLNWRAAA